jgi:hypothetical protein
MFTKQNKLHNIGKAIFMLIIGSSFIFSLQSCEDSSENPVKGGESENYEQLHEGMRKLWSDHMHWTLSTIDAFFNNQNALSSNMTRLLQNQKDIGEAIVPYYGQAAGDQLADLLTEHINLAVPVLQAAKAGDQAALQTAVANWNQNAKDIANFLTTANPENWPQSATEPALLHHIEHTVDYSVKIMHGDYEGANKSFEHALEHMLELADTLSEGIRNQFPNKF